MATEAAIIRDIEAKVRHYMAWTICLTDDPRRHSRQHSYTAVSHNWDAATESVAKHIEEYFLVKGMQGARRDGLSPHHICIYI